MRLVTYLTNTGQLAPGIEVEDVGVVDVRAVLGKDARPSVARLLEVFPTTRERLETAVAEAVARPERALAEHRMVAAGAVRLLSPLGERVLVVCTGANYRSHLAEMGEEPPAKAAWFVQNPNSVIGPGESITLPAQFPDQVDFEGELCVVFGRSCHNVSDEDALAHIAGYTILNDVSARDALPAVSGARTPEEGRWAWTDMLLGKQFPTFAPLGPAVVTTDEVADHDELRLTTTLNGIVMQDASTAELSIGIPSLIAQLSRHFCFRPGDVLSTGTPAGVGVARRPPVFLRPGDTITVEVDGIGALTNHVVGPETAVQT